MRQLLIGTVDDIHDPARSGALQTGATKALLINPPIYDTQYWAQWAQPYGLLRIGALLKKEQDVDALSKYDEQRGRYPRRWEDLGPRYNQ